MTSLRTNDARNRALRSFVQGLGIDIATALAALLLVWLPDADLSSRDAWIVLATGAARTVLQSIASYVMRAKLDGSALPTPLPPADPGEPDAPTHAPQTLGKAFTGGTFSQAEEDARRDGDPHRP
jgi:hypothetical protein